jgi:hypothetical protein
MRQMLWVSLLAGLGACAGPARVPATPVPAALRAPDGHVAWRTLKARGVQIYECRMKKDDPQAAQWAFVAPEAELFDAGGRPAGKHYAGPHWESTDGSKVRGSAVASADAPQPGAIPWLLLSTTSDGPAGEFANVTYVQRVVTVGGVAPAAADCDLAGLGKRARVPYSADYVMLVRA